MSLLSSSQLAAIQQVGLLGMTTSVDIYSQVYDTGLDLSDDPYGSELTYTTTPTASTQGWLVGRWEDTRGATAGADVDTLTTYRLRLPVGTSVRPGDKVVINSNEYLVSDAGTDQTWPEWLVCVLRRAK